MITLRTTHYHDKELRALAYSLRGEYESLLEFCKDADLGCDGCPYRNMCDDLQRTCQYLHDKCLERGIYIDD